MADSIPSLRRQLAEARLEIAALLEQASKPQEVREVIRNVETVRTVVKYRDRDPVVITEYVTDPAQEETIRELQERLRECQSISVSGL